MTAEATTAAVLRPSTGKPVERRLRQWRPATAPHAALGAVFMAAFTLITVLRYQRYGSASWDLGIFTEAVKAYAHLRPPIVPVKGEGFNILGDHFSPIIALLAPAFRLFPSAVTLLVVQAGLFAWSAGVVSNTAARLLGRSRGLCIGAAYGLSFGLQNAIDADFHEIAFAVPLLAVVCRQLLLRRWARGAWWALPLLLVKEDLGLTVAAVGVLLLANRRWRTGTALLIGGVSAAAVTVLLVVPHFNPAGRFDYWAQLPGGTHPHWWRLATQPFTRIQTWKTLGWTFGITGFLALRSPLALLTAPTLVWRFTATNEAYWGTGWHYSAVLMPIVFLGLADAGTRMGESRRPWIRRLVDRTVTAVPAVALTLTAALPIGIGDLASAETWSGGRVAAARTAALGVVPDGARVEAMYALLGPLGARTDVYSVGGSKTWAPDFIVLDRNAWDGLPKDAVAYGEQFHPGSVYVAVFQREGVTVLRRVEPATARQAAGTR